MRDRLVTLGVGTWRGIVWGRDMRIAWFFFGVRRDPDLCFAQRTGFGGGLDVMGFGMSWVGLRGELGLCMHTRTDHLRGVHA